MAEEVKDEASQEPERKPGALDIIVMKPMSPVLAEIVKDKLVNDHNVVYASATNDAVQMTMEFEKCLIYACIVNRKMVEPTCQLLMKLKAQIKSRKIKAVVLTKIINPQLRTMIAKLGITDYVEEPINARSLFFKINMQLKAVKTQIDKERKAAEDAKKQVVFKSDGTKGTKDDLKTLSFKKKPALEVGNDAFVFSGQPPQKKDNKYTVVYDGPSPIDGDWKKEPEKGENGQTKWKWTPSKPPELKDGKKLEDVEEVVFEGDKPQFNHASGQWQLKGEKPELSLQLKKKKIGSKLRTTPEGEVEISDEKPESVETALNLRKKHLSTKSKEEHKRVLAAKGELVEGAEEEGVSEIKEAEENEDQKVGLNLKKGDGKKGKTAPGEKNIIGEKEEEAETPAHALKKKQDEEKEAAFNNKAGKAQALNDKEVQFKSLAKAEEEKEEENKLALKKLGTNRKAKDGEDEEGVTDTGEEDSDDPTKLALKGKKLNGRDPKGPKLKDDGTPEAEDEVSLALNKKQIGKPKNGKERAPGEEEASLDDQLKNALKGTTLRERDGMVLRKDTGGEEVADAEAEQLKLKKLGERKQARLDKGKAVLKQIQDLAKKPIREDLTPKEVEELEVELAVKKGTMTPRQLAKKKRKKEIEDLQKQYLDDLNAGKEEDAREAKIHDLGPDRADYISADIAEGGAERDRSKMNAFDSVEKAPEDGKDHLLDKLDGAYGKKAEKKSKGLGAEEAEASEDEKNTLDDDTEDTELKLGKKRRKKGEAAEAEGAKPKEDQEAKDHRIEGNGPIDGGLADKALSEDKAGPGTGDYEGTEEALDRGFDKKHRPEDEFNDLSLEASKKKKLSEELKKKSQNVDESSGGFIRMGVDLEAGAKRRAAEEQAAREADERAEAEIKAEELEDEKRKKIEAELADGLLYKKKSTPEQETARNALNERLASRMKSANPALAEFLNKRKNADQLVSTDKKLSKSIEERFERVTDPENALLGFKMALSDAVHLNRGSFNPEKTVRKIIQQGVVGIGFCNIIIMTPVDDGSGIIFTSSETGHKPGDMVEFKDILKDTKKNLLEALKSQTGSIVGYLWVEAVHKRDEFIEQEANTLRRMIELFSPYWENLYGKQSAEGEERKAG